MLGSQVALSIPAGALSTNTTLTAAPISPPASGPLPGTSIDLGPTGTTFAHPITVTIGFDPASLPLGVKPAYLQLEWWNVDHWETLSNNSIDLVHSTVSATTSHFSIYAILPNGREFCPGDPTAESDFQTAINDAPAGGTLWICNGNFTVAGAIGKALNVRAENPGLATLSQDPAATGTAAVLSVAGVSSGTVSVAGLNVSYTIYGIYALDFDSLSVTGSTFTGPAPAALGPPPNLQTGVELIATATPPVFAFFDHDTFVGGNSGLAQDQPMNIVVTNSNFHDQGMFGLIFSTATGNQNPVPGGGPSLSRGGRAEFNTFTNCGVTSGACIALEESGADTVRFNTISMPAGVISDGIFINRLGEIAGLTQPAIITDNVLVGHAPIGDPTNASNWGFRGGIVENGGIVGVVDVIQRNQVNTAFMGIQMRGSSLGFVYANAQDNQIAHTYLGIVIMQSADVLTAVRNDITDYVIPVANSQPPFTVGAPPVAAGSLTCNWWGSASGPIGMLPGMLVASYTPFATAPIAKTLTVCP